MILGVGWLDWQLQVDWKSFFSLTRTWRGPLNKENKQDPSIQGFHSYAKTSIPEVLCQQFHHTNITCGQCCVTISMTTRLPSSTADLTERQRITTGLDYRLIERNQKSSYLVNSFAEGMTDKVHSDDHLIGSRGMGPSDKVKLSMPGPYLCLIRSLH